MGAISGGGGFEVVGGDLEAIGGVTATGGVSTLANEEIQEASELGFANLDPTINHSFLVRFSQHFDIGNTTREDAPTSHQYRVFLHLEEKKVPSARA